MCALLAGVQSAVIQFKIRTEYSFGTAYGPLSKVMAACRGAKAAAITDRHGTWGHVQWSKACKKAGIKPIFGVELAVVEEQNWETKKQSPVLCSFIALNNAGLREIYALTTKATEQAYYIPRLKYADLQTVSKNVLITYGATINLELIDCNQANTFMEFSPATSEYDARRAYAAGLGLLPCSDNLFPRPEHAQAYEVVAGRNKEGRASPRWILDQWELQEHCNGLISELGDWKAFAETIAAGINAELPKAEMVHYVAEKSLDQMCEEAAPSRGIDLEDPVYRDRLARELALIHQKKFEDYFYVIADMLQYAKSKMLVGPARGSSCGSLVCYLLQITEIDPIPYDLLFERFIDVNRKDLPDIDIDFPDSKRDLVFEYVEQKYGVDCVARLGTIGKFKAKSAISDVAKELDVPLWEITDLKNSIIERSGGDSRAAFCIADTFETLDIGKRTIEKYPQLRIAAEIEGHASHSGQHAAGIVVTAEPVNHYCSVDMRTGATQVDKYDAEELNLLKIDALGLRTLSVIEDCLEQIGWSYEKLLRYRTDDTAAFDALNRAQFAGIFQFEGFALQSLCRQLTVGHLEDIISMTALARPGPLASGGTTEFIKRRTGMAPVKYMHPLTEPMTKVSYGIVVYQEQVMQIAREVGGLSWEDVSSLRKAMSKSLGKEYFDQYWEKFKVGAIERGLPESDAKVIWENINTMGSWSFNRSHAVAYGMVSYWCCVLKAHYPLEYAAACLRHAKDNDQIIKLLRELDREGYKYKAFDKEKSIYNWSVQDGTLVGGLIGVHGIGEKIAREIERRKLSGETLTKRHINLIENAITPYDMAFECRERWGHIMKDPVSHGIASKIWQVDDINSSTDTQVLVIGKLVEKNLRDANELVNVQKRGGSKVSGPSMFLNITVEDDSGSIICTIDRFKYERLGKPIIESGKLGDWFLWRGVCRKGFRKIYIDRWKKLS